MAAAHGPHPVTVWVWLVICLVAGFVVFWLDLSHSLVVLLLFQIAIFKAGLVVRHYMHMKQQPVALYAIAAIPVLLLIFMVFALLPDIAYHR
jgi:cytochrome c oxidase subunit IV